MSYLWVHGVTSSGRLPGLEESFQNTLESCSHSAALEAAALSRFNKELHKHSHVRLGVCYSGLVSACACFGHPGTRALCLRIHMNLIVGVMTSTQKGVKFLFLIAKITAGSSGWRFHSCFPHRGAGILQLLWRGKYCTREWMTWPPSFTVWHFSSWQGAELSLFPLVWHSKIQSRYREERRSRNDFWSRDVTFLPDFASTEFIS